MTIFFRSASILALVAGLATAPAALVAQEQTTTTTETDTATDVPTSEGSASDGSSGEPMQEEVSEQPAAETAVDTAQEPAEPEMVEAVEGTITLQDEDTVLANDLLGATVYNFADEAVGDINDMIIDLSGTVEGVVIGVGGFLGIGEKDVALELGSIEVRMDDLGNPRLYVDASEESLEAAQSFLTKQEQTAMEAQQQANEQLNQGIQPAEGDTAQDAAPVDADTAAEPPAEGEGTTTQ